MDEYPTQEFLHDPDNGSIGDCWRACIAGLLDLPLADVPHFARDHETDWWERTVEFVDQHTDPDTTLVCLNPTYPIYVDAAPRVAIATGPSPRGADIHHAILINSADGTLIWDPHPSRAGLAGPAIELFALAKEVA